MKTQLSLLVAFFALFANSLVSIPEAKAQDTKYQDGTEFEEVETTETKNGQQIKKKRSGQVRQRKGEAQVGNIEDSEIKKYQKRHESLALTSLGFGPFGSSNLGRDKILYGFSYGRIWEPSESWDIRVDAFGAANSSGSFWSLAFGPSYIFSPSQISPFIGTQIGFAFADGDDENDAGFSGQINLGLKMFRLADKQMEVFGSYAGIFGEDLSTYGLQFRILF